VGSWVFAVETFDKGDGKSVYFGGQFQESPAGDKYLARWDCPPQWIFPLPGCSAPALELSAITPKLSLAQGAQFSLTSAGLANGVAQLWAASPGVDAAGCGLPLASLGEVLLSPVDVRLVASATLELGAAALTLDPIADPSLVGVTVALQGLALGGHAQGQTLELSNGLWTQIQP
jgi:hypothetical protein